MVDKDAHWQRVMSINLDLTEIKGSKTDSYGSRSKSMSGDLKKEKRYVRRNLNMLQSWIDIGWSEDRNLISKFIG